MDEPGARILLVDDELFFAARILSVLRQHGYEVERAATADEAQLRIPVDRPDLVILNLASPKLGGIPLARQLKEAGVRRLMAFLNHTRIPEVREEALAAGVDQLCANSAITNRLPELVERALRGEAGAVEE